MNSKIAKDQSPSRPRVLYVDDDKNVRALMAKLLTAIGCDVQVAWSGKDAVIWVQRRHFDLVMTDLEMPEMDGRELAKVVKEWLPDCPVVLLTGSTAPFDLKAEKKNGIVAIIHKPATLETLRGEVLRWIPK
jgi:CheY-like chemotaxis protein